MGDDEARYIADNQRVADHTLVVLQHRRLLRDRTEEDFEHCRRSADELRGDLKNLMLAVQGRGFLLDALTDMQNACTNFVTAAGKDSQAFSGNPQRFWESLETLRLIFGQRLQLIVREFDLRPSPEIRDVIDFAR